VTTVRTIPRFWHPRTGCTALLLLTATKELLIINRIPQHDPQPDSELARHRYTCFSQTFVKSTATTRNGGDFGLVMRPSPNWLGGFPLASAGSLEADCWQS
jgi:hypothetical protein